MCCIGSMKNLSEQPATSHKVFERGQKVRFGSLIKPETRDLQILENPLEVLRIHVICNKCSRMEHSVLIYRGQTRKFGGRWNEPICVSNQRSRCPAK